MSYECQKCKATQAAGTPSVRVVLETREVQHPHRARANRDGSDDKGGRGSQIVREAVVCPDCA